MSVNEKMTAIADAIRSKTGETNLLTLDGMAENVPKVYEAGKEEGNETFWKAISNNYTRTDWGYAFQYADLSNLKEPTQLIKGTAVTRMFGYYEGETIPKFFDLSGVSDLTHTFRYAKFRTFQDLKIPAVPKYAGTWQFCYTVETIEKVRCNEDTVFDASFHSCRNLKNIAFDGFIGQNISFEHSTVLSKASIINIFEHLSPNTSGKTLTLSLDAVVSAFGSDYAAEWIQIQLTKQNWNLALI